MNQQSIFRVIVVGGGAGGLELVTKLGARYVNKINHGEHKELGENIFEIAILNLRVLRALRGLFAVFSNGYGSVEPLKSDV